MEVRENDVQWVLWTVTYTECRGEWHIVGVVENSNQWVM